MNTSVKNNELEFIRNTIARNNIDIEVNNIEKLGEGWMSRAYLINDEFVFRFPKEKQGGDDLEKEKVALPFLMKIITLSIPNFIYTGVQENGLPFVGYRILNGVPMKEETFEEIYEEITSDTKDRLVEQIGDFIDEISSVKYEKALELGICENDFYKDYSDTLEEIERKIFGIIDENIKKFIIEKFKWYLDDETNFKYTPKLLHADLSPNHFLYDNDKGELTGIIDFGDMQIGDPDYEYIYLLEDCGADFTRKVMEYRGEKEIEKKLIKVEFFLLVDNICFVLEGLRINDDEMIRDGLASLGKKVLESQISK